MPCRAVKKIDTLELIAWAPDGVAENPQEGVCMLSLGEKLAGVRVSRGMTQNEVSEITDISIGDLVKYEKGMKEVPFSDLEKIAESLGKSPIYFEELSFEENTVSAKLLSKAELELISSCILSQISAAGNIPTLMDVKLTEAKENLQKRLVNLNYKICDMIRE